MAKKAVSIPVITLPKEFKRGIVVGKISVGKAATFNEAEQSHRHDFHFFILVEEGTAHIEIDFENCQLKKYAILYINPSQVHLLTKVERADLYLMGISYENIDARYLRMLEEIVPANPLLTKANDFSLLAKAATLCIDLFERKDEDLFSLILKDSCNTLIGLILSRYMQRSVQVAALSRFETITRQFRQALGVYFIKYKRPSDYANVLNISAPYLNECVKTVTGLPVSHHIQQRVILEAKRMLVHSDKSVKEIAAELGYEDYPYFSRLFTKIAGMTALTFRNKNLD